MKANNSERKIPQIIHYCWFGNGEKPAVFSKCLESWKKFLPEYEIIEWNERNIDLSWCSFVEDAVKEKKWAFVSDVVRLKVVYEMGGIYLDTDVELYSSWEHLMTQEAFFFFQNHNQLNTGLGFGAAKGNSLIQYMLEDYYSLAFQIDRLGELSCPIRNTRIVVESIPEFTSNNSKQCINEIMFLPFETYCSIAHHYGEFSWKNNEQERALVYAKKTHRAWKFRKLIRNPQIFSFFENNKLDRIKKIYTFIVYDFIDYGIIYWFVKFMQKVRRFVRQCIGKRK